MPMAMLRGGSKQSWPGSGSPSPQTPAGPVVVGSAMVVVGAAVAVVSLVSLAAAVEARTGRRPKLSTTGGTSDARYIKDYCPVVEFGLVGQTMHMVDENVPVADLEALTGIYETFIARWFSDAAA